MNLDLKMVRAAVMKHRAVIGPPTAIHLHPADVAGLAPEDHQFLTAGGGIVIESDVDVAEGAYSVGKGGL